MLVSGVDAYASATSDSARIHQRPKRCLWPLTCLKGPAHGVGTPMPWRAPLTQAGGRHVSASGGAANRTVVRPNSPGELPSGRQRPAAAVTSEPGGISARSCRYCYTPIQAAIDLGPLSIPIRLKPIESMDKRKRWSHTIQTRKILPSTSRHSSEFHTLERR